MLKRLDCEIRYRPSLNWLTSLASSSVLSRQRRRLVVVCVEEGRLNRSHVLSLPHKCSIPGYFFFSHPTKRVYQFNSIESPPPPAASYLLGGAELKGKRIRPESDPARAIQRHPICRDPTCVAGARSPKPLQNRAHVAPPTARPAPDAPLDPPREF